MTTYFSDNFTGSNGASWNATNWIIAKNTTGATATIQANRGRMNAGSITGYSGKMAMRRNAAAIADVEIAGIVNFGTTSIDGGLEIWLRSDTNADSTTGYFLSIDRNGNPFVGYTTTGTSFPTIGNITLPINGSTDYSFRFYAVGTTIKAKVWATSGAEPVAYQVSITNSAVSAAGAVTVHAKGGNSGGFTFDLDDVVVTNGVGNQFTFTGSIQPTNGTFRRALVTKNAFTGSSKPTGAWSYIKVVTRLFTGSSAPTGKFIVGAKKILTGVISSTGVMVKRIPKMFTGSITGTGFYRNAFVRVLTGGIQTTGTLTVTFLGRVFGRPGVVAVAIRAAGEAIARVRRN
jgi:hypothetical protein